MTMKWVKQLYNNQAIFINEDTSATADGSEWCYGLVIRNAAVLTLWSISHQHLFRNVARHRVIGRESYRWIVASTRRPGPRSFTFISRFSNTLTAIKSTIFVAWYPSHCDFVCDSFVPLLVFLFCNKLNHLRAKNGLENGCVCIFSFGTGSTMLNLILDEAATPDKIATESVFVNV